MKPETLIYEKIKAVIPNGSEKIVTFAAVSVTSYEIYFYSFNGEKYEQCFALAEQGRLDGNELDVAFHEIARIIREAKEFREDKYNIATIIVTKSGVKMHTEYYEKDVHLYKVKKEWGKTYLA